MEKKKRRLLSNDEIVSFCGQMAMILRAGMSSLEGLSIMAEDAGNQEGKRIVQQLYEQVDETGSLAAAVESCGVFPKYVVDMVEIGERSGKLDEVMASLSDYYEREESISKGIKNAVTYPFIMIGMMLVIVLVLVMKVLPIFEQVFIQLGSEMSGFSKGILNIGKAISRYSVVLVVVFVVCVAAFLVFSKTSAGKRWASWLGERFYFTKKLRERIASSRFAAGMALMLSSGLDINQGLEMVEKLVDHTRMRERIISCREMVADGEDFSEALTKAGIFTGMYAKMVSIGYKTGAIDEVLTKIADQYQEEVDSRISKLVSVLEPTLVAVLSVIVGMILLSVMLPLMGIMSSIG